MHGNGTLEQMVKFQGIGRMEKGRIEQKGRVQKGTMHGNGRVEQKLKFLEN